MRMRILLGLTVVAASMVTSCSSEPVTAPITLVSSVTFNTDGEPLHPPPSCDPAHEDCHPDDTCDPLHEDCHPDDTCDPLHELCHPPVDGRMTGGGGQIIIGDVYITRGLTLHCDITLSNNLEINWPGNKWHLDKPITSALCIDNPSISPEPPAAPFDTFIGEGIGRLNGVDGSLVKFTFVDAGEPGGRNDKSAIQIFDKNGVLVLNVPLDFLTRGNLQAHYDQPHK